MFCIINFYRVALLNFTGKYIPQYTFSEYLELPGYVKLLFIKPIRSDWDNTRDFLSTNFLVVTTLLGAGTINGIWHRDQKTFN